MYYKMFDENIEDEDIATERDKIVDDFTSFLLTWSLDRAIEIDGQYYPREFFTQKAEETDEVIEAEAEAEVIELKPKNDE